MNFEHSPVPLNPEHIEKDKKFKIRQKIQVGVIQKINFITNNEHDMGPMRGWFTEGYSGEFDEVFEAYYAEHRDIFNTFENNKDHIIEEIADALLEKHRLAHAN